MSAKVATKLEFKSQEDWESYRVGEQVGFLLRVAAQRHASIFASRMIDGLTAPQFAALSKLMEVGACSQNHLGRLIFLDVATIKGVVERLRARRLVASRSDPRDGRRHEITLTTAGRKVLEIAIPIAEQITAETLRPLAREDRVTLRRLLTRIG